MENWWIESGWVVISVDIRKMVIRDKIFIMIRVRVFAVVIAIYDLLN
jgi:hypothetical protein